MSTRESIELESKMKEIGEAKKRKSDERKLRELKNEEQERKKNEHLEKKKAEGTSSVNRLLTEKPVSLRKY